MEATSSGLRVSDECVGKRTGATHGNGQMFEERPLSQCANTPNFLDTNNSFVKRLNCSR